MKTAANEVCFSADFFDDFRHLLAFEELSDSGLIENLFDNAFPDVLNGVIFSGLDGEELVDFVHFEHTPDDFELFLG